MRQPPSPILLPLYPVTGGTILLAIGVTLASWSKAFDIAPLLQDGHIRQWQLWRCVSNILPHGSAFHLIFNVYWVWVFGSLVEEVFGHLRTFLIFVLLALGSGAAEYALFSGGIGLSGVGYGLFGMLWVLARRDGRFYDAIDKNTTTLFVVWFFACIVLTVTGAMPIANVAHGMGAALGAILGWAIVEAGPKRQAAIGGLILLTTWCVAGATLARPWINLSSDGYHDEFQLGYDALAQGRDEEGVRWYRDVVRMAPHRPAGWFNLGLGYERLGKEDEARHAFERAYELDPNDKGHRARWNYYHPSTTAPATQSEESPSPSKPSS